MNGAAWIDRRKLTLRQLLAVRGLKQADVSLETGIDSSQLSRVVNGRQLCPPKHKNAIAEALGVTRDGLESSLYWTEHEKKGPQWAKF